MTFIVIREKSDSRVANSPRAGGGKVNPHVTASVAFSQLRLNDPDILKGTLHLSGSRRNLILGAKPPGENKVTNDQCEHLACAIRQLCGNDEYQKKRVSFLIGKAGATWKDDCGAITIRKDRRARECGFERRWISAVNFFTRQEHVGKQPLRSDCEILRREAAFCTLPANDEPVARRALRESMRILKPRRRF